MVTKIRITRILALMLMVILAVPAARAEVKVSIDRNPVQVNESFQLVFSLDHDPDRDPDFSILQQHFQVIGNNRSSSISIINGKFERSVKWTLQLLAKQVGEYMIPAIRFDQERTEPFQITVEPSSLASVPHKQLLLEFEADRQSVPVQAQVILKLRLLSGQNLSAYGFGDISIKDLDAVLEPLGDVRKFQTRIADQSYLVLEKRFALFPQQSGPLVIPPVVAEVRLTSGSAFDPFQTGGKIQRVQSQSVTIDVEPIPQSANASHWLPAKQIELREQWQGDLNSLVAGEPITRTLTLIADGLTSAQLPEFALGSIDGIKQYPDQPVLQNSRGGDGITGQRVQKVALIPGSAGRFRLPEINLQWWNTQSGKMETATIPARDIVVNDAAGEPLSALNSTEPLPTDLKAVETQNPFWLWTSLLLAIGWAVSALYWWLASSRKNLRLSAAEVIERPSLRAASKLLRQSCADNNATAARRDLLGWGQALLAPEAVENLHRLGERLGPELTFAIEQMNQSLYAADHSSWNGDRLGQLCQQIETQTSHRQASDGDHLVPLNPGT